MKYTFRKTAALLLCAAMLCAGAGLSGCNGSNEPPESALETAYSPTVPENPIASDAPGESVGAKVGETVNYQDKVSVTLNKVVELDHAATTVGRVFCAELTIINNSDSTIDCTTLTHFTCTRNGETDASIVRDISASVAARKYYTAIGSNLLNFNTPIAPGETAEGYVYMRVASPFEELTLTYIPYKYYSNDTVDFSITEADLEHYTALLNQNSSSGS